MNHNKPFIICDLSNQDFGLPSNASSEEATRESSRGILIDNDTVALIYLQKLNYHKLPGGGIEKGETPEEAFHREIMEETGCTCTLSNPQAITVEHRNNFGLRQISHVFFGKVTENTLATHFDTFEIEAEGSELKWVPRHLVSEILEKESPTDYEGQFIHFRDLAIWKYYFQRLQHDQ